MDPFALAFPIYVGGIVFGHGGGAVDHGSVSVRTDAGACQVYDPAYGGRIRGDGSFQLVIRCTGQHAELLVDGVATGVNLELPPAGGFFPATLVGIE